jgi:hypothetical protein
LFLPDHSPDINECLRENKTCFDVEAECVNTVGSYICQCKLGFTRDEYNCSGKNSIIL